MSHGVTLHKCPLLQLCEAKAKHLNLLGKETARLQLAMQWSGYGTGELVDRTALETASAETGTWLEQTRGPGWIGDSLWLG